MSNASFNRYYQDELLKLRDLSVEFSRANPALAPMLSGPSSDPDVERLLEGVAFLNGLTRQKLDDEFPELVQELANQLFPHYLRPVPASTLMQFEPRGALSEPVQVRAGTELASAPVDGTRCVFRTSEPLRVDPLVLLKSEIVESVGAAPVLRLDFELRGLDLSQWNASAVRLFLGASLADACNLYLLLMTRVSAVEIGAGAGPRTSLGVRALRASGFDHPLLSYPDHAFPGFRLIQEYFALPEKLLFVSLEGLERWSSGRKGERFSVWLTLTDVPEWMPELREQSLRLHVVPALNLFARAAEPIQHHHRVSEYRVRPESASPGHYQIFSVDRVSGWVQGSNVEQPYALFGRQRPGESDNDSYRLMHRPATVGRGQDLFISLATPPGRPLIPQTLSLQLQCTNNELPERLKLGEIDQPTSTSPERLAFRNIRAVTPQLDAPANEQMLWRMVSHISLNFLSLANADNLKTLLGLYIFSDRQDHGREIANRHRVAGVEALTAEAETRLIGRRMLSGQKLALRCRSSHFASVGSLYLFGCVIERFLGDYAAINAYTRLELRDSDTGVAFEWPARLGRQCLL
ncbi:MAG: type VI secretion system baseplate subunit TssF [Comamonadaceae bacterium]|nr:MAG: type VI secretion system baseplate subunit TssF [Comamonadaceae bacterium]